MEYMSVGLDVALWCPAYTCESRIRKVGVGTTALLVRMGVVRATSPKTSEATVNVNANTALARCSQEYIGEAAVRWRA